MSIIDRFKGIVGGGGGHANSKKRFECQNCENEFESFKLEERASCPGCLSNDVRILKEL